MKITREWDKPYRRRGGGWIYFIDGRTIREDGSRTYSTSGVGNTLAEAKADFICQHTMGVGCPIAAHKKRRAMARKYKYVVSD